MYLDLETLTITLILATAAGYWWRSQSAKATALRAARRECEQWDVLLLDQSVYLCGLGLNRDGQGRLRLRRTFCFEFTATGENRYQGRVILLGPRAVRIEIPPHRVS